MKKLMIAATAVGAAAAGLILYYRRKRNHASYDAGKVVDAASSAYKTMNDHMERADRPAQHAMG